MHTVFHLATQSEIFPFFSLCFIMFIILCDPLGLLNVTLLKVKKKGHKDKHDMTTTSVITHMYSAQTGIHCRKTKHRHAGRNFE